MARALASEELYSTAARSPTQDRPMASIMSQAEHDLMIFTAAISLMDAPLLPAVRTRRRGFKTRPAAGSYVSSGGILPNLFPA